MSDVSGPFSTTVTGIGTVAGATLLENAWGFAPYAGSLAPVGAQIAARVLLPVGVALTLDGALEMATGKSAIRWATGRSFNEHVRHTFGLDAPPAAGVRVGGR